MNKGYVSGFNSLIKSAHPDMDRLADRFRGDLAVFAVLAVLCAMGVYYYGMRAAAVAGVCAFTALAADIFCLILCRKHLQPRDLSPLITGLSIACMLPACVPYTIAAAACLFAVCAAKHPFGGRGCEIICPAAAGYIFAELSFPQQMGSYPRPFEPLSMSNIVPEQLYRSMSGSLSGDISDLELLVGATPGTLGCTGAVTVIVCVIVLVFIGALPGGIVIPEIAIFAAYTFSVTGMGGIFRCPVDIFAAALLSCGGHIPSKVSSRIIFGIISGVLIIMIREMSTLSYPAVYAAVIAAPFAFLLDTADDPDAATDKKSTKE